MREAVIADWRYSILDSHPTRPKFTTRWVRFTVHFLASFLLNANHDSIEVNLCLHVERREGFLGPQISKTLKWVVVASKCTFSHQLIAQQQVGPVSVYCDMVGWQPV